jgi:ubiquinone/menaquinone biosynthesis C-methylase UbiE
MDTKYEEYWQENKVKQGSPYDLWKKKIIYQLPLEGDTFFDLGCGNGEMASFFNNKFTTYGVDISSSAIKMANNRGIIARCCDASNSDLPYNDEFFDNISCLDVLEHLIDPEKTLQEIHRIIKPNGTLIVCVPNALNIFNRLYFLLGDFVDIMDVAHRSQSLFSEHIRLFSKNKLESLLNLNGFKVVNRFFYFPQQFSENKWKRFQLMGNLINFSRLPQIRPSLFALAFLYICQKKLS